MKSAFTFILAGGEGKRLSPLTNSRAKPLLPFLGSRRLIDFTLLNCVRSGIFRIWVLACNDAVALNLHTSRSCRESQEKLLDRMDGKRWVDSLKKPGYAGTADAVRQNLSRIPPKVREVLVLAADHVYTMDYGSLLDFHRRKGALVTVGAAEVGWSEAGRFGILEADAEDRAFTFQEKPRDTAPLNARSPKALASMGIYIFDADFLSAALRTVGGDDFGRDILPVILDSHKVFAFNTTARGNGHRPWQDVGTIDSYWEAQVEILKDGEGSGTQAALGDELFSEAGGFNAPLGTWTDARGTRNGEPRVFGRVFRSALSRGVWVSAGAEVYESILLEDAQVGPGARLWRTVVDRGAVVSAGEEIGFDRDKDGREYPVSEGGVVVIAAERPLAPEERPADAPTFPQRAGALAGASRC
ncbi:MAG: NTP transferase domain-containing protein [Candidatus Tectomicrobia bacterium]|nr:NTP transferase domain-containing protein [Candidatus Tectomicrobia bacterium]